MPMVGRRMRRSRCSLRHFPQSPGSGDLGPAEPAGLEPAVAAIGRETFCGDGPGAAHPGRCGPAPLQARERPHPDRLLASPSFLRTARGRAPAALLRGFAGHGAHHRSGSRLDSLPQYLPSRPPPVSGTPVSKRRPSFRAPRVPVLGNTPPAEGQRCPSRPDLLSFPVPVLSSPGWRRIRRSRPSSSRTGREIRTRECGGPLNPPRDA